MLKSMISLWKRCLAVIFLASLAVSQPVSAQEPVQEVQQAFASAFAAQTMPVLQLSPEQMLHLLMSVATLPPNSSAIPDSQADNSLLAQRVLASAFGWIPADTHLAELLKRQNADGGFGTQLNTASNPSNTAFAVIALISADQKIVPTTRAFSYLGVYTGTAGYQSLLSGDPDGFNHATLTQLAFLFANTFGYQSMTVSAADRLFGQGVLFGIYQTKSSTFRAALQDLEKNTGKFMLVKRYRDFSNDSAADAKYPEKNGNFPDLTESAWYDEGRTLDFAWESRIYNGKNKGEPVIVMKADGKTVDKKIEMPVAGQQAQDSKGNISYVYTYKQIYEGQLDVYLAAVAERLRRIDRPFLMHFDHEWDDTSLVSGGGNIYRAAAGTPEEYAKAFRYLVTFMRGQNVKNIVWAWTVSGWRENKVYTGGKVSMNGFDIYRKGWPGSDYVDVIGWDPYNHNVSAWKPPLATFRTFYDRLDAGLLDAVDPQARNLPRILSEYGSVVDPNNANRRIEWINQIPAALKALPKLRSISWFASTSTYNTRLDDLAAQKALGDVRAKVVSGKY